MASGAADHAVKFQLFVQPVFQRHHIPVHHGADAPYPLHAAGPLQLAQGVPHHGAAHPKALGQLHFGRQLGAARKAAGFHLLNQLGSDLAGAQLTPQPGGFVCFFHAVVSFSCAVRQTSRRQQRSQ